MNSKLALMVNEFIHEQCIDGTPHNIGWNVIKLIESQTKSIDVKVVDTHITEKDFIKAIKESSDYVNVDMAPVFEDEWFAVAHNCLILAQSMVTKSQSNIGEYSKDQLLNAINYGAIFNAINSRCPNEEEQKLFIESLVTKS